MFLQLFSHVQSISLSSSVADPEQAFRGAVKYSASKHCSFL